jgi:protein transport protein SEC23
VVVAAPCVQVRVVWTVRGGSRAQRGSALFPRSHTRNHFPPHYNGIHEQNLPAELFPSFCTIEYTLPPVVQPAPPAYIFVVDMCVAEDELAGCQAALMQALQMIPEYAQVGLITYGTHVHVHELGFAE